MALQHQDFDAYVKQILFDHYTWPQHGQVYCNLQLGVVLGVTGIILPGLNLERVVRLAYYELRP